MTKTNLSDVAGRLPADASVSECEVEFNAERSPTSSSLTPRLTTESANTLKQLKLIENLFEALCSWTYNLGSGALQRSSLRRLYLNDGRYEEAADELLRWVFCNGRRLRGLVLRRMDERALFLA